MLNHYTKYKRPERKLTEQETVILQVMSEGVLLDSETLLDLITRHINITFTELKEHLEQFIKEEFVFKIKGERLDALVIPHTYKPRYEDRWVKIQTQSGATVHMTSSDWNHGDKYSTTNHVKPSSYYQTFINKTKQENNQ